MQYVWILFSVHRPSSSSSITAPGLDGSAEALAPRQTDQRSWGSQQQCRLPRDDASRRFLKVDVLKVHRGQGKWTPHCSACAAHCLSTVTHVLQNALDAGTQYIERICVSGFDPLRLSKLHDFVDS